MVTQLIKKFPALFRTQRLIAVSQELLTGPFLSDFLEKIVFALLISSMWHMLCPFNLLQFGNPNNIW
jgi:hypothetical protein